MVSISGIYVTLIVAGVKQAGARAEAAGTAVARLVAFGDFVSECAVQALGAIGFSRQM